MRVAAGEMTSQHAVLPIGRVEDHRQDRGPHSDRSGRDQCCGHYRREFREDASRICNDELPVSRLVHDRTLSRRSHRMG